MKAEKTDRAAQTRDAAETPMPMEGRFDDRRAHTAVQRRVAAAADAHVDRVFQRKRPQAVNETGMPDRLKTGIESLSGVDMSDVRVHRNSDKPTQLNALAYAQGSDIHLGPGQDRYLPHEAWHVVQQRQGRVNATTQMAGVGVNDDAKLESEADAMGEKAVLQGGGMATVNGTQNPHPSLPIVQRADEVTIAGAPSANVELNTQIRARKPEFHGEMWFNTAGEANAYAAGTAEGMGVWNGDWINIAGVGTIVFGEEHNDIREDVVAALNIQHRLVEGAFERSLDGVAAANIPPPPPTHAAHGKYTGGTQFKALENYWLRGGQYMARFAAPTLAELNVFADGAKQLAQTGRDPDLYIAPLQRPGELLELIRTLKGATVPDLGADATPKQKEVNDALSNAKFYAVRCEDFGLETYVGLAAGAAEGRRGIYAYRAFVSDLKEAERKAHLLYQSFALLAEAVEELGTAQFRAIASRGEISADVERQIDSAEARDRGVEQTGFEVWSPRREVAMLANLTEALTKDPRPMLVTLGSEHAKNRREEITAIPGVGRLVIGAITDLLALGKK